MAQKRKSDQINKQLFFEQECTMEGNSRGAPSGKTTWYCDYCKKEIVTYGDMQRPWTPYWITEDEFKISCRECTEKYLQESKEKKQDASNEEKASSSMDCD